VAVTFQAFVVPELDRQSAFSHSQNILYNFEKLYTEGKSTISLAYSGTPIISPATYTGQLAVVPSVGLNVPVQNATQLLEEEKFFTESQNMTVTGLSGVRYYFTNVTDNVEATCNFTSSQNEQLVETKISTQWLNDEATIMRLQLNVTVDSMSNYYNYSIFYGDTLELNLLSPIYNFTSKLLTPHKCSSSQIPIMYAVVKISVAYNNQPNCTVAGD
jgi:hypothetical protein